MPEPVLIRHHRRVQHRIDIGTATTAIPACVMLDWLLVELRNVNAMLEAQRAQLEQRKEGDAWPPQS